jgi:tetratricopeptide (TPR) repeat protein
MMKKQLIIVFFVINSVSVISQTPPEEFFKGLDLLNIDKKQAKKEFLIARDKDTLFHGTYHFLGVIYLDENKVDSAIFCFKKSVALNKDNVNHTREMAYVRLIDTYLYEHDFLNSFSEAWEAYQLYPDNNAVTQDLKDVCLWSFYIKHNGLDSTYLSSELKDEYIVNSVPEEYLIFRKIKINDNYLVFNGQRLIKKKGNNYDVLSCVLSKSNEKIDVIFKLNWNPNKDFGGNLVNTNIVYNNLEIPIYERIGARLVEDSKIDLKQEIEKLHNK